CPCCGRQTQGPSTVYPPDGIRGPLLDLLIDPAYILAHNAEGQELCADKEEQDGEQGEYTLCRPLGAEGKPGHRKKGAEADAEKGQDKAGIEHCLQGKIREGCHQVELQRDKL